MSIHQIEEYYVHLDITEDKESAVRSLAIDNRWDYEINGDSITVDGFTSENEAKDCDIMIQDVLSC